MSYLRGKTNFRYNIDAIQMIVIKPGLFKYKTSDGRIYDTFEDAAYRQGMIDEMEFSSDEEPNGMDIPGEKEKRRIFRTKIYGSWYNRKTKVKLNKTI